MEKNVLALGGVKGQRGDRLRKGNRGEKGRLSRTKVKKGSNGREKSGKGPGRGKTRKCGGVVTSGGGGGGEGGGVPGAERRMTNGSG